MDKLIPENLEWLMNYCRKHKYIKRDVSLHKDLKVAIADYVNWLSQKGINRNIKSSHRKTLGQFVIFAECRKFNWDNIFEPETLDLFTKVRAQKNIAVILDLSRFLYQQKRVKQPSSILPSYCDDLEGFITDYQYWLKENGYRASVQQTYGYILEQFFFFIIAGCFAWEEVFTFDTLNLFRQNKGETYSCAIRGFSKYLFKQGKIKKPIRKPEKLLPDIYQEYFLYCSRVKQSSPIQIRHIKRVLSVFHDYLRQKNIPLNSLNIIDVDIFLAEFSKPFSPKSVGVYHSYLRGFLKYLFYERSIIKRDIASLVNSAPVFSKQKPPKYLRPEEIKILFESLSAATTEKELRTSAMIHLGYYLGLRPKEICLIKMEDISFEKGEIEINDRKSFNPIIMPLPEEVIKAIAAYILGGRPKTEYRRLFITLGPPYTPASANSVTRYIGEHMRKLNLPSTAYWLRHTFAQNLLEAGLPIWEIKEMLGHDEIESTTKYLHVHIKLMREVLFED